MLHFWSCLFLLSITPCLSSETCECPGTQDLKNFNKSLKEIMNQYHLSFSRKKHISINKNNVTILEFSNVMVVIKFDKLLTIKHAFYRAVEYFFSMYDDCNIVLTAYDKRKNIAVFECYNIKNT